MGMNVSLSDPKMGRGDCMDHRYLPTYLPTSFCCCTINSHLKLVNGGLEVLLSCLVPRVEACILRQIRGSPYYYPTRGSSGMLDQEAFSILLVISNDTIHFFVYGGGGGNIPWKAIQDEGKTGADRRQLVLNKNK